MMFPSVTDDGGAVLVGQDVRPLRARFRRLLTGYSSRDRRMGMVEGEWARAPGRPRRPSELLRGSGTTTPAHPLGRLALGGNRAIVDLIGRLSVQRAPGDPPPTPVFGGTGANGTVSLYHYGDLTTRAEFSSPPGYPRLTDYDLGTSQADAATYTGSPVGPKLNYKYELRIDRDYFEKNFVNTGTRKGYSEYVTAKPQKIPTSFFRRVARLTVKPPGGGGGPTGPGGGTPPITGGSQTPLKTKAAAGAALAALGMNIAFNWIIGWQNEKRIAAALAAREAELKAVQLGDATSGILLTFRFAGGVDSGEGPTADARFEGLSYVTGRSADEARQTWNNQARQDAGSRYDFVWVPPLSPVAAPPPGWSPVARGEFADLKKVQFQRLEFAQIGGFDTDGTLGPHDFSTLRVASGWEFVILGVPKEIPYYGPGGGYNTRSVTVENRSVAGGQVPAMIVDDTACVAVVSANSDTLEFFNDKGIAARTRIDDKVNALRAVVNIDEVRWLRLDQIRLKK
jgi:hypothetical protein